MIDTKEPYLFKSNEISDIKLEVEITIGWRKTFFGICNSPESSKMATENAENYETHYQSISLLCLILTQNDRQQQSCNYSLLNMSVKNEVVRIIEKDTKLNDIYEIHKKLSNGCFGYLFYATHKQTGRKSALKIELFKGEDYQTLSREYKILLKLQGIQGIPVLYNFGVSDSTMYLQLELLDKDLGYLGQESSKPDIPFVCWAGAKLLKILQSIHQKNVIHRDLKPQNIMLDKQKNVYLIDFGISKENGKKFKEIKNNTFVGTPRYASIAAHKGKEQTPIDDIESLMYNLIYLAKRKLPWVGIKTETSKKLQGIMQLKLKTAKALICQGLPDCFMLVFEHIAKIKPGANIDYPMLIQSFLNVKISPPLRNSNKKQNQVAKIQNRRVSIESNFLLVPGFSTNMNSCGTSSFTSFEISGTEKAVKSSASINVYNSTQRTVESYSDEVDESSENELTLQKKIQALAEITLVPKFKSTVI